MRASAAERISTTSTTVRVKFRRSQPLPRGPQPATRRPATLARGGRVNAGTSSSNRRRSVFTRFGRAPSAMSRGRYSPPCHLTFEETKIRNCEDQKKNPIPIPLGNRFEMFLWQCVRLRESAAEFFSDAGNGCPSNKRPRRCGLPSFVTIAAWTGLQAT